MFIIKGLTFTAIDFETANSNRLSACAIGLCKVTNGEIEETIDLLIRPPQEATHFESVNVCIHGITYEKVCKCNFFCDQWPAISEFIKNRVIVAHNMSFDNSVLIKLLDRYSLQAVHTDTLCTLKLAKKALFNLENYKLDTVCRSIGYNMNGKHHNAGADALACAKVLLYIAEKNSFKDMKDVSTFMNTKNIPVTNKPALQTRLIKDTEIPVYHGPVGANSSTIFWNPAKRLEAEKRHAEEKKAKEIELTENINKPGYDKDGKFDEKLVEHAFDIKDNSVKYNFDDKIVKKLMTNNDKDESNHKVVRDLRYTNTEKFSPSNTIDNDIYDWYTESFACRGDNGPTYKQVEYIKVLRAKYNLDLTKMDLYSKQTARDWISKAVDFSKKNTFER